MAASSPFPAFPNFYSSGSGKIKGLEPQKFGILFFYQAVPRCRALRLPLIARFRFIKKTFATPAAARADRGQGALSGVRFFASPTLASL